MVELLKIRRINNRLLCKIATHEDFVRLLADAEIYVDSIATMRIRDLNEALEAERAEIVQEYQSELADNILRTWNFANVFSRVMFDQLEINYDKLSPDDRSVVKKVMKKSPLYRNTPLSQKNQR